jgi:hypothetical protein
MYTLSGKKIDIASICTAIGVDRYGIIEEYKGKGMQSDRYGRRPKEDPRGSKETQDKKMLNAEIKRTRKAMTKAGHSKEEIAIAIKKLSGES